MRSDDDVELEQQLRGLRGYDFADKRDVEIFSTRRRWFAGVMLGWMLASFVVVVIWVLWWVCRRIWG